jgi:hypothetical protein
MLAALLAAQITVVSTAPPLNPEEAVRVLRASRSELDRTNVVSLEIPNSPRVVVMRSRPGDGPFGPFHMRPLPTANPTITFRVPRVRKDYRRGTYVR